MSDGVPLFQIDWSREEICNAVDSISRGCHWAKGPYVDEFEEEIENYVGSDYAFVVNSGTTALVTALEALGIGPGDEVIVPSFTFIATANSVRLCGATPVFADIELDTFGVDPQSVREAITDNTKAILPVHCYGLPCKIHQLKEIATEEDVYLIEDAAEAFGAKADGEKVGTIGDIGVFSFCQNKIITTGEGGALVTDSEEIAQEISLHRSHGRSSNEYFESARSGEYKKLGSNYRMSDICAAVGVGQIIRINSIISRRRDIAAEYRDQLRRIDVLDCQTEGQGKKHVYQLFTVIFESEEYREQAITQLGREEIDCKVYWDPPTHRTEAFQSTSVNLPVTNDLSKRVLSLPIYPSMHTNDVEYVCEVLNEIDD